ncbi:MAG: hypothetical protein EOP39_04405 [Rubrivivax sp.]|nr:MAG: hypothetical protein EOP39_04405 [Rubrivivax sp.]
MLYTSMNVHRGTTLHDLDRREKVMRVLRIDTEKAEVYVGTDPYRVAADGESIVTETIRFAAVWPILDRGLPCAFHCHGRQN